MSGFNTGGKTFSSYTCDDPEILEVTTFQYICRTSGVVQVRLPIEAAQHWRLGAADWTKRTSHVNAHTDQTHVCSCNVIMGNNFLLSAINSAAEESAYVNWQNWNLQSYSLSAAPHHKSLGSVRVYCGKVGGSLKSKRELDRPPHSPELILMSFVNFYRETENFDENLSCSVVAGVQAGGLSVTTLARSLFGAFLEGSSSTNQPTILYHKEMRLDERKKSHLFNHQLGRLVSPAWSTGSPAWSTGSPAWSTGITSLVDWYHQLSRLVSESACEQEDPGSNPAADMVDAARNTAWNLGKQPNNYRSNYPTQEWARRKVVFHPIINGLQKIALYETWKKYYLIGSNATQTKFRVLKIDRTEPEKLIITDDKVLYSHSEIKRLLQDHSKVDAAPGSKLTRTTSAFGVVGFVRFLLGYYMILVTKRRKVASVGLHSIYKIEDTTIKYIPHEACRVHKGVHEEEQKYLRLFLNVDLKANFYFSYSYDLTRTLQHNLAPPSGTVTLGQCLL
ncbi:SAC domain [Trinorchestia longiramus]|nr:SAC domain [Trinorchestia longiramus]